MKLPFKANTPVRLTSAYGTRVNPFTGVTQQRHDGYDLVSDGDKTVCAVVGGKVVQSRMITDKANRTWEWGNYITILGNDGHYHYYCHLAQRAVEAGATVKAGDPIGIMGATGHVTGLHLHYEVRLSDGWTPISPEKILGVPNEAGAKQYIVKVEEEKGEEEMTKEEIRKVVREEVKSILEEERSEQKKAEAPAWAYEELEEAKAFRITDGTRPCENAPRYQVSIMCKRVYQMLSENIFQKFTALENEIKRLKGGDAR